MALDILAGPGCDSVAKDGYVASHGAPGDVVISVGKIYEALGGAGIPSSNTSTLRLALYLRTTAIKEARAKELSGYVLTSNANRADLDRLAYETGGAIRVLKMTEAEACQRIAQLVPPGERRAACEEGVRRRWFGRYTPGPDDREVDL